MDTKLHIRDIADELGAMIEERARELIADMPINVIINGVDVPMTCEREDHMDHIDMIFEYEGLVEELKENNLEGYDEPLTFENTGCSRRVA